METNRPLSEALSEKGNRIRLQILSVLLNHGNTTAGAIAQKLGYSRRTIATYLESGRPIRGYIFVRVGKTQDRMYTVNLWSAVCIDPEPETTPEDTLPTKITQLLDEMAELAREAVQLDRVGQRHTCVQRKMEVWLSKDDELKKMIKEMERNEQHD